MSQEPQPSGPIPVPGPEKPRTKQLIIGAIAGVALIALLCVGGTTALIARAVFGNNALEAAFDLCKESNSDTEKWASLADKGSTLIVTGTDVDTSSGKAATKVAICLMDQTKMPASVRNHVEHTRALDGTQTDSWDGIKVRWTYHPDNGLNMTFTID
jgi:hypothetical protein